MAALTTGLNDPAVCAGYTWPTYRVVTWLNLVPQMPVASVTRLLPEKPRLTNEKILDRLKKMAEWVSRYNHVNTLVYIDRDGEVTPDADIEPWTAHAIARAIATRGKSFLEGVTNHLIANCIRSLEEQPSGQKQPGVRSRRRAK